MAFGFTTQAAIDRKALQEQAALAAQQQQQAQSQAAGAFQGLLGDPTPAGGVGPSRGGIFEQGPAQQAQTLAALLQADPALARTVTGQVLAPGVPETAQSAAELANIRARTEQAQAGTQASLAQLGANQATAADKRQAARIARAKEADRTADRTRTIRNEALSDLDSDLDLFLPALNKVMTERENVRQAFNLKSLPAQTAAIKKFAAALEPNARQQTEQDIRSAQLSAGQSEIFQGMLQQFGLLDSARLLSDDEQEMFIKTLDVLIKNQATDATQRLEALREGERILTPADITNRMRVQGIEPDQLDELAGVRRL